jgi:hypothetical protein
MMQIYLQIMEAIPRMLQMLGLYIFALEEYGKGLFLRDCKKNAEGYYVVPTDIFGKKSSHENKIKKALDTLPHDCNIGIAVTVNEAPDSIRTITLKGDKNIISIYDWSTGNFSSTADSIQEDTRWRCFYVDWHDKERYWKYEFFVADKDLFSNAISVLIKYISQECRVSS